MAGQSPARAPRILGLTGPIACGKTTVGDLLLELGALERIDADRIVHQLMSAGTPTTGDITRAFGPQILRADGAVDRSRLGAIVFADPARLGDLERIVHPAVRSQIRQNLARLHSAPGIVVLDAVKLLQSDLADLCEAIWLVQCGYDVALKRLTGKRHLTGQEARQRLAAQPSFDDPRVTAVLVNSGTLGELRAQVERRWKELSSMNAADQ